MSSVSARDSSASMSRQVGYCDEAGWSPSVPIGVRKAVEGAFFHLKRYVVGMQLFILVIVLGLLLSAFQNPRPAQHWLVVIVMVSLLVASEGMFFRLLRSACAGELAVLDARPPRTNLIVLGMMGSVLLYDSVERFLAGGPPWWLAHAAGSLLLMATCFHGCRFVSLANRVFRLLDAEEDRRHQSEERQESGAAPHSATSSAVP